ncbi:hypothetical protein NYZ99_06880 [Maribacter litopenaei]|uniref:Uncharacterized protein n=1 Tax=Maribacter litopenaei TaxID=2976127 RepID=A0ABY5YAE8_9FLAO|nr:hypothetical protein [Maribacter litopenaei]UWX56035.1 hypothetical protein NYZ99_06880 [Maribacter litopenaei]
MGPAGDYDIYVRDSGGCISFDIATVIQLDLRPSGTHVYSG